MLTADTQPLDGDRLMVGPRDRLTDEDREQIRRWKRHLLAIVADDADTHACPP